MDTASSDFQRCVLKQNICKKRYFNSSWFESHQNNSYELPSLVHGCHSTCVSWLHAVFQIACCRSSRCPTDPLLRSSHALAHSCLFLATTWFCTWGYSWAKLNYSASPNTKSWKPSINEGWELVDKHTNILTLEWDRSDKSSVKHPTSPQWGQPQEPARVTCSLIHSPLPAFFPLTHWASRNHLPKNLLAFKALSQVCFWKNPN